MLIAGDSIYPVEYWDQFGVLYYTDPDLAIDSLSRITKLDWDYIVPGHGDVLSRDEGIKLARENIGRIKKIDKTILFIVSNEMTESEILAEVIRIYGAENVKAVLNILKPVISGHLSSFYRRGLITVKLDEKRGLVFKIA